MESSVSMNAGDGPNSYFKNSKIQEQFMDSAKVLLSNGIKETLEIQNQSKVFTIADLGCSTGPNTFSCVNTIIEAVQHKYKTSSDQALDNSDGEILPEFHVFFNDRVDNDFNTLFKSLPQGRQYMAAGVPGSFYGRLFPKSSMNLMHSSTTLHWLKRAPEEVMKRDSSSFNKGRITYVKSPIQVVNAFRDQFFNDFKDFLKARSEELTPGGLLAILMMSRPDESFPSDAIYMYMFECFGDALVETVKEGVVGEDLADSFNIPIFIPSRSEVKEVVSSNKNLSIEMFQEIHYPTIPKTPGHAQMLSVHGRAVLEGIVSEHFGPKLTDQVFERYPKAIESFIETPYCARIDKQVSLFILLKRKDDSAGILDA